MTRCYHFDPIDPVHMAVTERLSPGQRIQRMLDAREILVGLIRGRVRQDYPQLSLRELNLKVLEEIEDARQHAA